MAGHFGLRFDWWGRWCVVHSVWMRAPSQWILYIAHMYTCMYMTYYGGLECKLWTSVLFWFVLVGLVWFTLVCSIRVLPL